MRRRFKKMVEKHPGRWTDWVFPQAKSYLMKCCDCGLVHELQFKAFAETKQTRSGLFTAVWLPWPIRAAFRARRWKKRGVDNDRVLES